MTTQAVHPLVSYAKALERQMEAVSNNLANVDTTGYKQDQPAFQQVFAQTMGVASTNDEEQFFHLEHLPPYSGRGQNFVAIADMGKDFSQGQLKTTDNKLDFGLADKNSFFSISTPQGERFTRAGNFRLTPNHELINAEGFIVSGKEGPLKLDGNDVEATEDGTLMVDGKTVGGLKIVTFPYPERLQKMGNSQFAPVDVENAPRIQENVKLKQGVLENSNVDSMKEVVRMIEVNHAYTSMQKAIASEDEINKKAITLAEV
ncbi:MAG: flagellar hook-basal body protein [Deltaproteobacteria bacterium]|nr:flagellar hook-basal body protein [Deltaproteobacteria bacterium]